MTRYNKEKGKRKKVKGKSKRVKENRREGMLRVKGLMTFQIVTIFKKFF